MFVSVSSVSEDADGVGHGAGVTQLGSSSWLEDPSSSSPSPFSVGLASTSSTSMSSFLETDTDPSPCTTRAAVVSISLASLCSVFLSSAREDTLPRGPRTSRTHARAEINDCRAWSKNGNDWKT